MTGTVLGPCPYWPHINPFFKSSHIPWNLPVFLALQRGCFSTQIQSTFHTKPNRVYSRGRGKIPSIIYSLGASLTDPLMSLGMIINCPFHQTPSTLQNTHVIHCSQKTGVLIEVSADTDLRPYRIMWIKVYNNKFSRWSPCLSFYSSTFSIKQFLTTNLHESFWVKIHWCPGNFIQIIQEKLSIYISTGPRSKVSLAVARYPFFIISGSCWLKIMLKVFDVLNNLSSSPASCIWCVYPLR